MRRLARRLFALLSTIALLLSIATCVFWIRSQSGTDTALWTYDRAAPDGSGNALSDWAQLISDDGKLSISAGSARAGPPRPELAVGIHINVAQSGGRPRLHLDHQRHSVSDRWLLAGRQTAPGTSGWGPLRWERFSRFDPGIPMWQRSVHVHVSHWLAAAALAFPAALALALRVARRRRRTARAGRGLCPSCGYDLRQPRSMSRVRGRSCDRGDDMKRLSRALFTLVSALSLLLCVTVCALWARSQRSLDMLLMETAWHRLPGVECRQTVLSSTINQLNVIRSGVDGGGGSWNYGLLGGDGRWRLSTRPASWHVFNDYAVNRFGFAWGLDRRAGRPGAQEFQWFVSLPHPFVAALFAVPPALWLSARMRDARQRCRSVHKLCVACGYDLRASAGRCPECGEMVKETATASARVVRR